MNLRKHVFEITVDQISGISKTKLKMQSDSQKFIIKYTFAGGEEIIESNHFDIKDNK